MPDGGRAEVGHDPPHPPQGPKPATGGVDPATQSGAKADVARVPAQAGAPTDQTLDQTLRSLDAALQTGRPPRDFSDESLGALLERQSEYVEELGTEAIRIARRAKADVVSAVDVDQADQLVRSAERTKRGRAVETFGGILLGGGLGQLYAQIALADEATTLGWVVAAASAALGLVLLTFAFARRW